MLGLIIEKGSVPAVRQLCDQLRRFIGSGTLAAGTKLPATRQLAAALGIARNTVVDAYEQLLAEGYLVSRVGSGTYVAEGAAYWQQDAFDNVSGTDVYRVHGGGDRTGLAGGTGGAGVAGQAGLDVNADRDAVVDVEEGLFDGERSDLIDFTGGSPDLSLFPRKAWGNHLRDAALWAPDRLFDYGDAFGDGKLRAVLADYLFRAKGIRAEPGQIAIVAGSSEGFLLIAHALANRYHTVVVEEPTVEFGRNIFAGCGYALKPVDVDEHGLRADRLVRIEPGELLLLTPSHQYPTGSILSIQRRRRLVKLAEQAGSYLIEDDYDSEFRFRGAPVPPLQVLAPERVIHVGTFSKTLSPGLRLGFVILPWKLIDLFRETKENLNLLSPNTEQRALAHMIENGDFERHLYRMTKMYRHKRAALVEAVAAHFGRMATVYGDEAGMHLVARFALDREVNWREAEAFGVRIQSTDEYRLGSGGGRNGGSGGIGESGGNSDGGREGTCHAGDASGTGSVSHAGGTEGASGGRDLVFGYGHLSLDEIHEGVRRLAKFLGVGESGS